MDKVRCFGNGYPDYERYHDEEWGRPVNDSGDEHELFERLSLEVFQSGLSWLTVLRKRDAFREVFAGFRPAMVAEFNQDDVERLLDDARIIRNRRKIEAVIVNARALVELHEAGDRLSGLLVTHAPPPRAARPATGDEVPSQTPGSVALSRHLHQRGFRHVGPVTLYSTMQAVGLVDDHLAGCWLAAGAPSEGDEDGGGQEGGVRD